MSSIEQIEYLVVALVILLQLLAFHRTWKRISIYQHIIPTELSLFSAKRPLIVYPDINEDPNTYRAEVVNDINGYLERNIGSAPDFNLVKDIAERNTQVLEESIAQNTSVPLYLGLMGTMAGIVAGLWNMSDLSSAINSTAAGDTMGDSINVLLGGVKIAMVASFVGIMLTVISSSYLFTRARKKVEQDKNRLYTFIQARLFPVISRDVSVAMQSLQNNMLHFSERFEKSLATLEGLFDKNYKTLQSQENILTALENIEISSFVKANVKMMQELRQSMDQLQRFNQYLDKLTEFTGTSQKFSAAMEGMLSRTDNIEDVLQNIDAHFSMSADLLNFLKSHFSQLEARGNLIQQSVVKIDTVLDDGLNELKEHVQGKIQAIKDITIAETGEFSRMLEQSRGGLGKLMHLETMNASIAELVESYGNNFSKIETTIKNIEELEIEQNRLLKELKSRSNSIINRIKWFFKKPSQREAND